MDALSLRRVAWSLAAVSVLLAIVCATLALLARNSSAPLEVAYHPAFALGMLLFTLGGTILTLKVPRNPVGWLLAVQGPLWLVQGVAGNYARFSLSPGGEGMPGLEVAAWVVAWSWPLPLVLIPLLLLRFPDGRLPSGRWRVVVWAALAAAAAETLGAAIVPGEHDFLPDVANLTGVGGAKPLSDVLL